MQYQIESIIKSIDNFRNTLCNINYYTDALTLAKLFIQVYNPNKPMDKKEALQIINNFYRD